MTEDEGGGSRGSSDNGEGGGSRGGSDGGDCVDGRSAVSIVPELVCITLNNQLDTPSSWKRINSATSGLRTWWMVVELNSWRGGC